MAFRFSAIERLPEPPTQATVRGRVVHAALERLFAITEAGCRDLPTALEHLDSAWTSMQVEIDTLDLDQASISSLRLQAQKLVQSYFDIEDPNSVPVEGTELQLEAKISGTVLRGIIDRLDISPAGELTVTDYKTGRPPSYAYESSSLAGVMFYALLCEEALGKMPVQLRLYYLGAKPLVISTTPSQQSIRALRSKTAAIWTAIERACENEDFRPRPSALCKFCSWKMYCPAFGGDLSLVPTSRRPGAEALTPLTGL